MDIPTHAELVEKIDCFLERHNFAPTRLGREATGEPNLIPSIKAGRQPNLDTLNKLGRLMAEYDAKLPVEEETSQQRPLQSATKSGQIIRDQEGGHGGPFLPFSATSSATPAPLPPSPASQACSPAGEADAA